MSDIVLTGNRTATDKNRSLEFVVRRLLTPNSLPIITISNLYCGCDENRRFPQPVSQDVNAGFHTEQRIKRVDADYTYCERCAERLTEIVLDLDNLRGTPRLFIPGQAILK